MDMQHIDDMRIRAGRPDNRMMRMLRFGLVAGLLALPPARSASLPRESAPRHG